MALRRSSSRPRSPRTSRGSRSSVAASLRRAGSSCSPSRSSSSRSAAPLLLSTDAWTYWGYGWIAAEGGGNPYVDPPSDFPESPAAPYLGADVARPTTVYGPAFTLVSEPVALVSGDSSDAAAWLFKALAAAGRSSPPSRRSRGSPPRPALAAAFVGWNPVLAVHVAGGGHNDALVGGLAARALALAVGRRHELAGAAWVLAAFVKWIPLVFLVARGPGRPRARARDRGLGASPVGARRRGTSSRPGATASTGSRAFGPLADNAVLETSYALPSRLEQLGLPDGAALAPRADRGSRGPPVARAGSASRASRGSAAPRASCSRRPPTSPSGTSPGRSRSRRPTRTASPGSRRSRSRHTCCRRRFRSASARGRGSRPRRTPARTDRTPRGAPARGELLGRDRLVAMARPRPVDRDPLRLPEHREAEDPPSLREVGAERVRRAHGGVGGNRAERARRDRGVSIRRRARARRGRTPNGTCDQTGSGPRRTPAISVETTIARPSGRRAQAYRRRRRAAPSTAATISPGIAPAV